MGIKRLDESPTIADKVVIDVLTPDEDGCFLANPYKVDKVQIFYVARSFFTNNQFSYIERIEDSELVEKLEKAKKEYCDDPTAENLAEVELIQKEIDASVKTTDFNYSDARAVATFGADDFPAWLSTDIPNALITNIPEDADGNPQYGVFELEWNPVGMREGDYFVCWTWTPLVGGQKLSAHRRFMLFGSTQLTTSIPTHYTNPKKYPTLQERYLPEMFKNYISDNDLTPEVLQELNLSVAKGFTFVEDMANQMQDLLDANSTHESLIPFLSNLFGLKLRSSDPTLWRRQIKRAVPLFKKKGTLDGLKEAMAQAGMVLTKFVRLWQLVSPYTYQEHFTVEDSGEFILSKTPILPIDVNNFELYYRGIDDENWQQLTSDYVSIAMVSGVPTMTWVGDQLSIDPIELEEGDGIRVVYEIINVPSAPEQQKEDYIRALPLMDQRDEREIAYPLKNWNVRVIEEDDPMFDTLVPDRHPHYDPIIYGKIRTEFPYSENVYNMEEYNGSKRDSYNPCDIDRDFLDACSACLSSKYNVVIEISELSNDRLLEAMEILEEFTPFHAVLHTITFQGGFHDFIQSPVEQIEAYIKYHQEDLTISGNAQMIFNRDMAFHDDPSLIKRNALANSTTAVSSASGTAKNDSIVLFSPDVKLSHIAIDKSNPSLTFLEILGAHPHAGEYSIKNVKLHHADIIGSVSEPINQTSFNFRLSNEKLKKVSASVTRDNIAKLSDEEVNFGLLGTKSQWDIDNGGYSGGPWKIDFISPITGTYDILDVLPDGSVSLYDPSNTLPTSNMSDLEYELLDNAATPSVQASSTTGKLTIHKRGRVEIANPILVRGASSTVGDIRNLMEPGYYALIGTPIDQQYKVSGFVESETDQFYIDAYDGPTSGGITVTVYQRVVDNQIGYLHYKGLTLLTVANHETGLPIVNGQNPPATPLENDRFKENYLVVIDTDYFAIEDIDGTTITLSGPQKYWTVAGTAVTYSILHFEKLGATIPERESPYTPGHTFEFIDRRGNDVIEVVTETGMSMMAMASTLNAANNDQFVDNIGQKESITFSINWKEEK